MKKLISIALLLCIVACNNEKKTDKAVEPKQTTVVQKNSDVVKTHSCTVACKDGFHIYLHAEIGHTCDSQCGKAHVCSDKCKKDTHVYAHGEIGHYCLCSPTS